jgi:hypothetical protein
MNAGVTRRQSRDGDRLCIAQFPCGQPGALVPYDLDAVQPVRRVGDRDGDPPGTAADVTALVQPRWHSSLV